MSLHFENTENFENPDPPRLSPAGLVPLGRAGCSERGPWRWLLPRNLQELGALPASPPRWGSAFGFEGTVVSSAGPGNLSLIGKEKVDSSRLLGQEIHFGYLSFQKEIAFPSQFPQPTRAATSLEIPVYDVGEIAKTE